MALHLFSTKVALYQLVHEIFESRQCISDMSLLSPVGKGRDP